MAVESNIQTSALLVPRHYVLTVGAALAPTAMLELMQALEALASASETGGLFSEDSCGGLFGKLREACGEAYTGDLPQPIVVPDAPPDGDEGTGGVPATVE